MTGGPDLSSRFFGRKQAIFVLFTLLVLSAFTYIKFDYLQPIPERPMKFHDFLEYYPLRERPTWSYFVSETAARPPAPTRPAHIELSISVSTWNKVIYAANQVPFTISISNRGSDAIRIRLRLYVLSDPDQLIFDFADLTTNSMEGNTRLELLVFYPVRPEFQGRRLTLGYFAYSYRFLVETGWVSETIPPASIYAELIDFGQISFQTYPDRLRLAVYTTLFSLPLVSFAGLLSKVVGEARLRSALEKSRRTLVRLAMLLSYVGVIVMFWFLVMLGWTFLYGYAS